MARSSLCHDCCCLTANATGALFQQHAAVCAVDCRCLTTNATRSGTQEPVPEATADSRYLAHYDHAQAASRFNSRLH
jgi:hypothetical protein